MKELPFLSKMVYKKVKVLTSGRSLLIRNFLDLLLQCVGKLKLVLCWLSWVPGESKE